MLASIDQSSLYREIGADKVAVQVFFFFANYFL